MSGNSNDYMDGLDGIRIEPNGDGRVRIIAIEGCCEECGDPAEAVVCTFNAENARHIVENILSVVDGGEVADDGSDAAHDRAKDAECGL